MSEPKEITVEEMVAHIDSIKYVETERDAEVLQAIRKHLEKKTVSREWVKKWAKYLYSKKFWERKYAGEIHRLDQGLEEMLIELDIIVEDKHENQLGTD